MLWCINWEAVTTISKVLCYPQPPNSQHGVTSHKTWISKFFNACKCHAMKTKRNENGAPSPPDVCIRWCVHLSVCYFAPDKRTLSNNMRKVVGGSWWESGNGEKTKNICCVRESNYNCLPHNQWRNWHTPTPLSFTLYQLDVQKLWQ